LSASEFAGGVGVHSQYCIAHYLLHWCLQVSMFEKFMHTYLFGTYNRNST